MSEAGVRTLRDRTREELFDVIRSRGQITRAELTEVTGMSRSTINQAVSTLTAQGRIRETAAEVKGPGSGRGRPAARLEIVARDDVVAAIDFGHTHVQVALGDSAGRLIDSSKTLVDVDLEAKHAIDCAGSILSALMSAHSLKQPAAVVAGVPGPVDVGSGAVCSPTILSGWVGLVPAVELCERIGFQVHVENDAFLGALGIAGAQPALRDFLYVKASHGIGAGVIINGTPYRGASGLAGEIGHTMLPGHAELCRCGNKGCLEAVVSAGTLHQHIAHTHPGIDVQLADMAALSDPIATRVLINAGRVLGEVLADHVNLLNPQAIIIGGELGRIDGSFITGVREGIDQRAQPATAAALTVSAASGEVDPELAGALQLASQLASQRASR